MAISDIRPARANSLIPLGVVWAGYLLIWYGWSNIKNWGIGLTDLIKPSAIDKVEVAVSGGGINAQAIPAANNAKPSTKNGVTPATGPGSDTGNIAGSIVR